LPDFITKENSVLHDSFSSSLNSYTELEEFIIGKTKFEALNNTKTTKPISPKMLFNQQHWLESIAPKIEHPQYTRPEIWQNSQVPTVLTGGDHKKIDKWRKAGWRNIEHRNGEF